MISKSRAVVLHHVKYSETSLIVTLYTESFGRQSYMVNGIRSPKSKLKTGILQPLFLLEIDAYHKSEREVQLLKEFKLATIYSSIPFDIVKSTISMFIAELMFKVIRNEENEEGMFDFIFNTLTFFDSMNVGSANFHLWFALNLLGYLGLQPENNHDDRNVWFDIKSGKFVPLRPANPITPDLEESKQISLLLSMKHEQLSGFFLNGNQRYKLLTIISEYYHYHFEGLGEIRSLKVLTEIFH